VLAGGRDALAEQPHDSLAHLMHDPRQAVIAVQRVAVDAVANKPCFARIFQRRAGPRVLVGVEVHVLRFAHQRMKHRREFAQPRDPLDSRDLARLLLAQLGSFPGGDRLRRFAQEQNLAVLFFIGLGIKEQNRLFLLNPGEIKEV
jgi:hypothetical protein